MEEIYMKWRPDFNLGIEEIDKQHRKIVDLINELSEAFMKDTAREKLSDIFKELIDYADYHFKDEEALFSAHNFPFTAEHIEMHKRFIQKVTNLKQKYEEDQPVTFRVLGFMKEWLTDHILDADREYASLVKANKK